MKNPDLFRLIIVCLSLFTLSCASKKGEIVLPEQIDLKRAKEFQEAGRYELALDQYSQIKNKYPLSPAATEAELELAETFFLQGSYIEAQAAFETFRDLHPTHPKVDFSAFRVGMSFFNQIPQTVDRDLTPATKAIKSFEEFSQNYPNSSYVGEALEKKELCRKKLAEKEYYIADFYLKREHYAAAQRRLKVILRQYRNLGFDEKALFYLGFCYYQLKNKDKAKRALTRLTEKFPQSSFADEAKKILKDL
jgi:outer membrane protein assembly factor BamD